MENDKLILFGLIIFFILGGIFISWKLLNYYEYMNKKLYTDVYTESCIVKNNQNIIDYNLKCISSLKVEENSYIAKTCYSQAKELYCDYK